MAIPEDYEALPPLPVRGQKPYFDERDAFDAEVRRRLEGYLSPTDLAAANSAYLAPLIETPGVVGHPATPMPAGTTPSYVQGKFGQALDPSVGTTPNEARRALMITGLWDKLWYDARIHDCTIEYWAYHAADIAQILVVAGTGHLWIGADPSGKATFRYGSPGSNFDSQLSQVPTANAQVLDDGQWHHCAVVFSNDGATARMWVDGILAVDSPGSRWAGGAGPTGPFGIGAWDLSDAFVWGGFIEEVRISNVARYLAPFTPPTARFEPDANTIALHHLDGNGLDATTKAGVYPERPDQLPAGAATYIGLSEPTTWLENDQWVKL